MSTSTSAVRAGGASARPDVLAELDDVSVRFPGKRSAVIAALEGVSMRIRQNEVVALVGPSGCGKSTTLRLIAGLGKASGGAVTISTPRAVLASGGLAMMFQAPTLLDWRTVIGNVALPLEDRGLSKPEIRERAEQILEMVGLADFADRRPFELSGGMQQRVAVARALITNPDLLLLDEPFSALDAITRDKMGRELERLIDARSMSVLLVTHSISEAIVLADRILVMSKRPGRVIEEIPVPLPRPRTVEDTTSEVASGIQKRMLALLE